MLIRAWVALLSSLMATLPHAMFANAEKRLTDSTEPYVGAHKHTELL